MSEEKKETTRQAAPLKPCAFCGGDAEMDTQRAYRNIETSRVEDAIAIYCLSCSCDLSMCKRDVRPMSDEDIIEALTEQWNRRSPPSPSEIRREVLEEAATIADSYLTMGADHYCQGNDDAADEIAKAIRSLIGKKQDLGSGFAIGGPSSIPTDILEAAQAELKRLYRAYVSLLEIGRDRLMDRGVACDPVDVMDAGDPALVSARATIALLAASPSSLGETPSDALLGPLRDLLAKAVRQWPEEWVLERDGAYATILRKGTSYCIASDMGRHQAALMVALRNAAPVLLAASPSPEIERLRAALTEIACFDDKGANDYLAARGSYGRFDEPSSVEIARKALATP